MSIFKIPVSWEVYGVIEIEAESLEKAIEIFDEKEDEYSLPEGDYIDGSFKRENLDFIKEFQINENSEGFD